MEHNLLELCARAGSTVEVSHTAIQYVELLRWPIAFIIIAFLFTWCNYR